MKLPPPKPTVKTEVKAKEIAKPASPAEPLDDNRKKSRSILLDAIIQGMKQDDRNKAKANESIKQEVYRQSVTYLSLFGLYLSMISLFY